MGKNARGPRRRKVKKNGPIAIVESLVVYGASFRDPRTGERIKGGVELVKARNAKERARLEALAKADGVTLAPTRKPSPSVLARALKREARRRRAAV